MTEEKKDKTAPAEATAKKSGPSPLALLLPALLAGGAAFGGAKFSAAHAANGAPATTEHAVVALPPPGPTVPLEPFLVVTQDVNKKAHAMKVTLAIEFDETAKEESLKNYIPRIRDATLGYLRLIPYEDAIDNSKTDKFRTDLLEKCRAAGATAAERILITDLVVQ